MQRNETQGLAVSSVGRFLIIRGLIGLLTVCVIVLQSLWGGGDKPLVAAAAVFGWIMLSSLICMLPGRLRDPVTAPMKAILFGDCTAAGTVVWATGSVHSPTLLLLTLPILLGGLVFYWRTGVILGLFTALLYSLLALDQMRHGLLPGQLWSLVAFHTFTFAAMGGAAGFLASRISATVHEVAQTRSELEAVRLSTESIIENLGCGLVAVDAGGAVVSLNPRAQRLLCVTEMAIGKQTAGAGFDPKLVEIIQNSLAKGKHIEEVRLKLTQSENDQFPALINLSPVTDKSGHRHGLVVSIWDLTEREKLEVLERRREQLMMVGELSAGLAHEIRNSLKPITGSIEMLEQIDAIPEQARPMMELITVESNSLEAFLSQFLTLARDKILKFEEIDLEDLIRREVRAIQVGRGWQERMVEVVCEGAMWVMGDRDWLRQIFRNCLINAFESDQSSTVQTEIECFESKGRLWRRVLISDDGPGLQDLDDQMVFGPFQTTKAAGTGLGLPIARRGVEEHGGKIFFEDDRIKGACVVVELPVSQQDAGGHHHHAA